ADGVTYEVAQVGGIAGWWARPANPRPDAAILHVHGGAFVVGSAKAHRHFAGHIAARAGVAAFLPDYRLAPEHPFPAGADDVAAACAALARDRVVIAVGDSAGGNLAMSLAGARAIVAMSPWLDLALEGDSLRTRADADPYLTPDSLAAAVRRYVGD